MRAAAAIRATRDDSLRRECGVQPIDTAKCIALPIVEAHVSKNGLGVMLASFAVAKSVCRAAQNAAGSDKQPRAVGERYGPSRAGPKP